jgi:cellulose synthase/poly-beta-1,6-N-acetylglucosamine synthase-like glycosyltransferase
MAQRFVSVLVPVRNEERYVERCLYSIASQDYPRERIEVLVLDGMSDDRTREIVARFEAESTLDLLLIENPRRLPAVAMNLGLHHARGDIIVRIDGHAAFAPDYVRRCVDALEREHADCAGGVLESEGDTFVGRAIAAALSSRFGVGGAAFRVGGAGRVDTVAFGAYRRDVFRRIGEFADDIERGEDDEFNYRLREAGGTIVLVPEARAAYTVRGSLGDLWRQYFGYGRAKAQVLSRHPRQVQPRQLVPAAFVAELAYGGVRAAAGDGGLLKSTVRVYALSATIASLALARRRGWRLLPPLPAVFTCMHVSYGLGFWAGVLHLAGEWARSARSGARESTEIPHP